jgi:uncharacterized protein
MRFVLQSSLIVAAIVCTGCLNFFEAPGTPLAEAAHRADVAAVRTLIAQGADPNAFGPDGQTALHWAARGGCPIGPHRDTPEAGDRLLVVATLLDLGADPDLVDRRRTIPGGSSGWTSLHMALRHEQFRTAALLLERGADPNILSQQRQSALAMAANEGAPTELLHLLLARGFDAKMARRPPRR